MAFNPDEMRGQHGKWARAMAKDLKAGAKRVQLPDGIQVRRTTGGHSVHNRAGREVSYHTGKDSAMNASKHAINLSLRSKHPKSIGGAKSYPSIESYSKAVKAGQGKAMREYAHTVPGNVFRGKVVTGGPANSVRAAAIRKRMK